LARCAALPIGNLAEPFEQRAPRRGRTAEPRRAMLNAGRIVFALGIVGFGVVGLTYVDFVNALEPVPVWLPGYAFFAILNGLLLLAAGLAILVERRLDLAARALAGLFVAWVILLQVPSAFTDPSLLRSPWWIRTFETVALTGGTLALIGARTAPIDEARVRGGRIAFGVSMPVFGVLHLVYPESVAALVPPWYPWPMFWAYFTGVAQVAGGLALAAGTLARPAAILAGTMYGTWALTLHVPRSWCGLYGPCDFVGPPVGLEGSRGGLTSLFVAFAMWGAAWLVAGALGRGSATRPPEGT
jgi:uncharacterized membrane protein